MRSNLVILLVLAACTVAWRLVPHDWNVAPMAALALFAGARLRQPLAAMLVPLAAMLLSDLVLGFYPGFEWVYAGMLVGVLAGRVLSGRSMGWFAGGAVALSLVFFLFSNFGVWLSGLLYPMTLDGLVACYVAALPFLAKSLVGDIFFTCGFYAVFTLADARARRNQTVKAG